VVTVEDGVRIGGAGSHLLDALSGPDSSDGPGGPGVAPAALVLGVPREFVAQGKAADILSRLGLDGPGVAASVRRALARVERTPTGDTPR
jgi:1-deoxy-D-xylulose-5-phosphate synthase